MKREIFLEKTSKYISIKPYLIGRLRFFDKNQTTSYLDNSIDNTYFGKEIRKKLSESMEVSEDVFISAWKNKDELEEKIQLEENMIIKKYKYKNKRELYKDTVFLSVKESDDLLLITPFEHYKLGCWRTIKNGIEPFYFSCDLHVSDEELGLLVNNAFNHCISIYK